MMTPDQLLLSDDRKARLEKALRGAGMENPLANLLAEAEAEVTRYTGTLVTADAERAKWVRSFALHKAYTFAGLGVPKEIQSAYDEAKTELQRVADNKLVAVGATQLVRGGLAPGRSEAVGGRRPRLC